MLLYWILFIRKIITKNYDIVRFMIAVKYQKLAEQFHL